MKFFIMEKGRLYLGAADKFDSRTSRDAVSFASREEAVTKMATLNGSQMAVVSLPDPGEWPIFLTAAEIQSRLDEVR